jgi:hypothetical protein
MERGSAILLELLGLREAESALFVVVVVVVVVGLY